MIVPAPNRCRVLWSLRTILSRFPTSLGGSSRTLDLLNVAVALQLQVDVFFSFHDRQRALAKKVGLVVG